MNCIHGITKETCAYCRNKNGRIRDVKTDVHVVPVFEGEPMHKESTKCWCEPELTYRDEYTDKRVFSHRRPT